MNRLQKLTSIAVLAHAAIVTAAFSQSRRPSKRVSSIARCIPLAGARQSIWDLTAN